MNLEDGVPEVYDDWMSALLAGEDGLQHTREMYPAKMMMLPETGHQAIARAMESFQSAVAQLHRAGRYVLGAEAYEDFIRDRDAASPGRSLSTTRGDQDG